MLVCTVIQNFLLAFKKYFFVQMKYVWDVAERLKETGYTAEYQLQVRSGHRASSCVVDQLDVSVIEHESSTCSESDEPTPGQEPAPGKEPAPGVETAPFRRASTWRRAVKRASRHNII